MKAIMKNISKYITLFILSLAISSCDDFLDRKPVELSVDNFYKTEEDAMAALVSVYDVLQWHTVQGYHPTDMLADIASDDAFAGGASSSDAPNIIQIDRHQVLVNNAEVQGLWRKYYIGIFRANILLEKIDGVTASAAVRQRIAAEAKFLRAYFYFDLVRLFENVPLVLKPLAPGEVIPQATPAATYNQIAKDLWEAKDNLPAERLKDGRISKWAAESLLSRVYLYYNGVYNADLTAGTETINRTAAITLLEDVINNSGHTLLNNFASNFTKANEFSDESIFEISYSDARPWFDWGFIQGGEGNIGVQMRGPRVDNPASENYERGWSFSTVTKSLIDALSNDPRKNATLLSEDEINGTLTIGYQHTGYFNKKYTTTKDYKPTGGQMEHNWGNNYRVIRYSDVLLMAAELYVRNGNTGSAKPYFDAVRDRVDLPPVATTLENILLERRLELALEGHRYWDLLRQGISATDAAITITNQRGDKYVGDQSSFNVQFNTARKGLLPIPQQEIDIVNGAYDQNDGY
jgi:starch-binding outer membrane protein, SusD/RagB family